MTHCGETETTDLWLGGIDLVLFIQDGGADDENDLERWKRHLKEPSCVVGEHRHRPLGNDAAASSPIPLSLLGDDDVETMSLIWGWDWDWDWDWEAINQGGERGSNKLQSGLKNKDSKLHLYTRLPYCYCFTICFHK